MISLSSLFALSLKIERRNGVMKKYHTGNRLFLTAANPHTLLSNPK